MFEVVVEGAAVDVAGERGVGLLGGVVLDVGDVSFGCVPDVLDRVVVRCVWWQVDQSEVLELAAWGKHVLKGFSVVESGVVQNDGYLVVGVRGVSRTGGVFLPVSR